MTGKKLLRPVCLPALVRETRRSAPVDMSFTSTSRVCPLVSLTRLLAKLVNATNRPPHEMLGSTL